MTPALRRPGFPAALCASLLLVWAGCASTPRGSAEADPDVEGETGTVVEDETGARLYVANQGAASVSVIDIATREVVATVDLTEHGFGPDAKPHDTAVEPGGSHWYVTLIGANRVLKFSRDGDRLVGQTEMEVPGLVAAHPVEDLLLVGRSMSAVNPPSSVAFVRRSDMAMVEELEVLFPRPHALALRGDEWAYDASLAENRMAVIDIDAASASLEDIPDPTGSDGPTAAREPETIGAVPDSVAGGHDRDASGHDMDAAGRGVHTLVQFAISPDGRWMVAGGEISGELLVFDLSDPAAPELTRRIELGGAPWHPSFTLDGSALYVPLKRADQVAVIDTATWQVVDRIEGEGIAEPHGSAPSPDGRTIFVSNSNTRGAYAPEGDDPEAGTVVAIDTDTREIVAVIEVGANAAGIDADPPTGN